MRSVSFIKGIIYRDVCQRFLRDLNWKIKFVDLHLGGLPRPALQPRGCVVFLRAAVSLFSVFSNRKNRRHTPPVFHQIRMRLAKAHTASAANTAA